MRADQPDDDLCDPSLTVECPRCWANIGEHCYANRVTRRQARHAHSVRALLSRVAAETARKDSAP